MLFSAHGLPERVVKAGDPYVSRSTRPAAAVAAALGLGQGEWAAVLPEPGRAAEVDRAGDGRVIVEAAEAKKAILLSCPIAFVSEHSETLVELDMDYAQAGASGRAAAYIRVPALGTPIRPSSAAWRGLVRQAPSESRPVVAFGAGCSAGARACAMKMPALSGLMAKGG